jgi:hypothetical protein
LLQWLAQAANANIFYLKMITPDAAWSVAGVEKRQNGCHGNYNHLVGCHATLTHNWTSRLSGRRTGYQSLTQLINEFGCCGLCSL